jgi:hypothetical protein
LASSWKAGVQRKDSRTQRGKAATKIGTGEHGEHREEGTTDFADGTDQELETPSGLDKIGCMQKQPVIHDGASNAFLQKHSPCIQGGLSGFDRLRVPFLAFSVNFFHLVSW